MPLEEWYISKTMLVPWTLHECLECNLVIWTWMTSNPQWSINSANPWTMIGLVVPRGKSGFVSLAIVNKSKSPFSSTIKLALPLEKFSQLRLKYFHGDSNLDHHIMHYQNAMMLYNNNDLILKLHQWFDFPSHRCIGNRIRFQSRLLINSPFSYQ